MAQVVDERGVIRQDGPELVKISEDIELDADSLAKDCQELFDDITAHLGGPDDSGKIWYGPRAQGCAREAEKTKPTFEAMEKALRELASKVNGDANSWGVHENSKY